MGYSSLRQRLRPETGNIGQVLLGKAVDESVDVRGERSQRGQCRSWRGGIKKRKPRYSGWTQDPGACEAYYVEDNILSQIPGACLRRRLGGYGCPD